MAEPRGAGLRRWWARVKAQGAVPKNHGKHVNGLSINSRLNMAEKQRAWNEAYWTPERRQAQSERMRAVYRTWGEAYWTPERRKAQGEAVRRSRQGQKKPGIE